MEGSRGMTLCRRKATRSGRRSKSPAPAWQPPLLLCPAAVGRRRQKPLACRDEGRTHPPFLQRACCPDGETEQTPQNLKTTTEAATIITSQSKPSTASCEAVSTLIQATIYKGLSRVCFISFPLTILFLIPPLSPTRRRRLSWLRDAPRTQI